MQSTAEQKPKIRAAQYMFRAVQYVRVSIDIQADRIREYAAAHGMEIVRTYANQAELDYFLLPGLDLPRREIRMCNRNSTHFEAFRFENLDFFYAMFERVGIWKKAS